MLKLIKSVYMSKTYKLLQHNKYASGKNTEMKYAILIYSMN